MSFVRAGIGSIVCVLAVVAVGASGCGSDDGSDEPSAQSTTTSASTDEGDTSLVGKWVATNECHDLVDALTDAGLEDYAAKNAGGAVALPPGKPDPDNVCAGAKPLEHSHSFSENGKFNSYDENGKEVDFGTYELTGDDTFTLSRPPFESEISYSVDGDTATFDVVVPDCKDKMCRDETALAITTFFPETYTRVGG